ncbi:MAG: AMP-binding protein, partial [Dehalococcoidia bacterium]|nr:AMP-binding protein [Dehalococcoidia bacterium]
MADTLPALFLQQASTYAARPLFWRKQAGAYQSMSWRDAAAAVDAFAAFLLQQGIAPGDRVLIFSENRPEWGIADLAIQSVGAWSVPLYPTLTPTDLKVIGADSRPAAAVVATEDHAARLASAWLAPKTLVVMDPGSGQALRWTAALAQGQAAFASRAEELRTRRDALRPNATATLIYTSGTTGEPKGVMLSHRNFLSNV